MKALSFSRPWDYLVLHAPFKDIENRTWPTNFRGRIYVHRAKSWDEEGFNWLWEHRLQLRIDGNTWSLMEQMRFDCHGGELVGEVDIIACLTKGNEGGVINPWYFGPYGFALANPKAYDKPIPYRGMPGLFDVKLEKEVTP
jgi:hypothetical protein